MKSEDSFQKIVQVVQTKASIKQHIYRNTCNAFQLLKKTAKEIVEKLEAEEKKFDEDVLIKFTEKGDFEFEIIIGGDVVLFQMHTNVFDFDQAHAIHQSSYVQEDPNRSYCGMINVFNFLADSVKYNRFDDSAYLIARAFVNKDNHFFMEGKRQLNFIHNDFINETIDQACLNDIVQNSILYSMNFDLFTPPYSNVQEISVGQLLHEASGMRQKTGKRMGYKFSFEGDEM